MKDLDKAIRQIVAFCEARDWKQFHNPKDLAISLSLESSEVLELFQWKSKEEIDKFIKSNKKDISEELSDVFYWVLLMSHYMNIDILDALKKKMVKNERKYPVAKAKGKHTKYNKL